MRGTPPSKMQRSIATPALRCTQTGAQPTVAGPRPARVRLVNAYLRRLQAAAEHDPSLALAFINVVAMIDRPRRLLHPTPVARVLAGSMRVPRRPATTTPASASTTAIPAPARKN